MAEGWVSLRDVPQAAELAAVNDEWIKALKTAQQYPSNWERRKEILGDELFEALKRTGSVKVAESDSYGQKALREVFFAHLKEIRDGIKTSN